MKHFIFEDQIGGMVALDAAEIWSIGRGLAPLVCSEAEVEAVVRKANTRRDAGIMAALMPPEEAGPTTELGWFSFVRTHSGQEMVSRESVDDLVDRWVKLTNRTVVLEIKDGTKFCLDLDEVVVIDRFPDGVIQIHYRGGELVTELLEDKFDQLSALL